MTVPARTLLLLLGTVAVLASLGCGGDDSDDHGTPDAGDAGDSDAGDGGDAGGPRGTGEPCTSGAQCESGLCLPKDLGGTCTESCEHDPDCEHLDFACLVLPDGDDGFLLGCGPPADAADAVGGLCEEDGDCRNRRCECRVCGAPCVDASDCFAGMICTDVDVGFADGTYRGCGFPVRTGDSQVDEIDLGTASIVRAFGTASSEDISVAVPCDGVSLTVNATQPDDEVPMSIRFDLVVEPDGDLVLDLNRLFAGIDQPLRNYPYPGLTVMTMLVPNSTPDRIEYLPGTYTWRQTSLNWTDYPWEDTDVEVAALVKRSDGPLEEGTLDLNVYPVGLGYSAAEAPDDVRLQAILARVDEIFGQVGISLGDITYYDIPEEEVGRLEVIDRDGGPDSELSDLFRLSAGREGRQIDVFLVLSLSGILGIAGGVPGPVGVHGTARSGVVSVNDPDIWTVEHIAGILAHELGHYLGLYHSTGGGGADFFPDDPIADTETGDETNLMNPTSLVVSRVLTEGQGFVLLQSPLIH